MAVNWDAIGSKLNKVLHNYAEFADKYYQFFTGPAQDVPVEYYDINGNKKQVTIPSVAKLRDRFINDVNSAMAKYVYVDVENGSDKTGDGTQSAPFKTLQKAIDSVPSGGHGYIYLLSNYIIDSDIVIANRMIDFYLQGWKIIFNPTIRGSGNEKYKGVYKIFLYNSYLGIYAESGSVIEISENYPEGWDNAYNHAGSTTLFTATRSFLRIAFHGKGSRNYNLKVPNGFSLANVGDWWGNSPYGSTLELDFVLWQDSTAILDGDILQISGSDTRTFIFHYRQHENAKLIDSQGNAVDPKTKISGIIKDSNGVPRNIISNLIL